jgi:Holliday junction DNA helicase RuvA
MITRMTGLLVRVLDDEVRLEVGPYEYQVLVPEAVRWQIQHRTGQEVTFHVIEYLEGNQGGNRFVPRRLGFLSETELEFFELFCTVEKIGAKKALKAMARPVREIAAAVARQDARWLSTLPGIGVQTADAIVTALKRKVARFSVLPTPTVEPPPGEPTAVVEAKPRAKGKKQSAADAPTAPDPSAGVVVDGQVVEDVYQALMSLGHNPVEARAKLDSLLTCGKPFKGVEDALALIYSRS